MYKVLVYNFFTGELVNWLVRAFDISYSVKLNDIGQLEFSMDLEDDQTTYENLKLYHIVRVKRFFAEANEWRTVFCGYIQTRNIEDRVMKVSCPAIIGFFNHRICPKNFNATGEIGVLVHYLLDYTNTQGETPVSEGINECEEMVDLDFRREKVWDCWKRIMESSIDGIDIWVDDDSLALNVGIRGTDKSGTVAFQRNSELPELTNVEKFTVLDNGESLVSRVIGVSGTYETIVENEIEDYPLLETTQSFSDAKTMGTLLKKSQNYLDDHNFVLQIPRITPTRERDIFDHYWIGDYVTIRILQNNLVIERVQRILAISVKIGDNNDESISIETSDGNDKRMDIIDVMVDHELRLKQIENSNL